jgi:hypothetical protein
MAFRQDAQTMQPLATAAGLTPKTAIVTGDGTPTPFFFRWMATVGGRKQDAQTPWTSNIDASGFNLVNLAAPLGVGVASPKYPLDVAGDVNITGAFRVNGVPIGAGGAPQTPWTSNIDAAGFALTNAGAISAASVTAAGAIAGASAAISGRVGIGAVTPGYPLDVAGDVNCSGVFRVNGVPLATGSPQTPWASNIDAAGFALMNAGAIGAATLTTIGTVTAPSVGTQTIAAGNATLSLNTNAKSRIAIDPTGIVGINPMDGQTFSNIVMAGSGGGYLQASAGPLTIQTQGAFGLSLNTNNVPRVTILSGGNIGVRTTSPAYALDVAGDVNVSGMFRIAGVPFQAAAQSPWVTAINAAGFALSGAGAIGAASLTTTGTVTAPSVGTQTIAAGSNALGLNTSGKTRMGIDTTGIVSVNTIDSQTFSLINMNGGGGGFLQAPGGPLVCQVSGAFSFLVNTNGKTRFTVDSAGHATIAAPDDTAAALAVSGLITAGTLTASGIITTSSAVNAFAGTSYFCAANQPTTIGMAVQNGQPYCYLGSDTTGALIVSQPSGAQTMRVDTSGGLSLVSGGSITLNGPQPYKLLSDSGGAFAVQLPSGSALFKITNGGAVVIPTLPPASPGAGSKQLYYNSSTNQVYYAP